MSKAWLADPSPLMVADAVDVFLHRAGAGQERHPGTEEVLFECCAAAVNADGSEQPSVDSQPRQAIGHIGRRSAGVFVGSFGRGDDVGKGFADNDDVQHLPWSMRRAVVVHLCVSCFGCCLMRTG